MTCQQPFTFIADLLGFETVNHSPLLSALPDDYHWTLLRRGGIELMLNTAYDEGERPAIPDASRIAIHGETVLFFGCPDVDDAFHHLCNQGLTLNKPTVAPYGMKQLSLSDPDGYGLCFQWPA